MICSKTMINYFSPIIIHTSPSPLPQTRLSIINGSALRTVLIPLAHLRASAARPLSSNKGILTWSSLSTFSVPAVNEYLPSIVLSATQFSRCSPNSSSRSPWSHVRWKRCAGLWRFLCHHGWSFSGRGQFRHGTGARFILHPIFGAAEFQSKKCWNPVSCSDRWGCGNFNLFSFKTLRIHCVFQPGTWKRHHL